MAPQKTVKPKALKPKTIKSKINRSNFRAPKLLAPRCSETHRANLNSSTETLGPSQPANSRQPKPSPPGQGSSAGDDGQQEDQLGYVQSDRAARADGDMVEEVRRSIEPGSPRSAQTVCADDDDIWVEMKDCTTHPTAEMQDFHEASAWAERGNRSANQPSEGAQS